MNKIINLFLTIVIIIFAAIAIAWVMSDFSNAKEIIKISEKIVIVLAILFVGVFAVSFISKNNKK